MGRSEIPYFTNPHLMCIRTEVSIKCVYTLRSPTCFHSMYILNFPWTALEFLHHDFDCFDVGSNSTRS